MRLENALNAKLLLVTLFITIMITVASVPISQPSQIEWIKPGVFLKYSKEVSFKIIDNQTIQLIPKLNWLNYSSCSESSIYKVIAQSELSFAMVKEVINITVSDNPFCNYLNIIDEGSRATTASDSEIALVFSWYTIPSFQRKIIDKNGYVMPWYSGLYIFFTPTYIADMGNEFSDQYQNTLEPKYYGLDTLIQSSLWIKYSPYTGFMDNLWYQVTLAFRTTNETSYITTLQTVLNIKLIETNIPVERIEMREKLKLPLIIAGVSIGIIIGLIVLRIKLKKYLK